MRCRYRGLNSALDVGNVACNQKHFSGMADYLASSRERPPPEGCLAGGARRS